MNRFVRLSAVLAVFFCLSSCGYSVMKKNEEAVHKAWSGVEANLHRRADIIPDLVMFVSNIAPQEKGVLNEVIEARSKTSMIMFSVNDLSDLKTMTSFTEAHNRLSGSLSKMMDVVDRYPNLKTNPDFINVLNKLKGTEDRMAVSCVQYNKTVETLNQSIKKFPYNVTNKILLRLKGKETLHIETTFGAVQNKSGQ